ncbi:MAG: hypothetical protein ACFNL2_01230, partial [Tannerella forsythia]|uniref:hypothetical protein n=1 Tax=Tannerella forsythia TaxID=28112 RepID=UPI00360F296A
DAIEQSNLFKSNIMENYTLTYNISQKYLLLPIEDSAPETKVQLAKRRARGYANVNNFMDMVYYINGGRNFHYPLKST